MKKFFSAIFCLSLLSLLAGCWGKDKKDTVTTEQISQPVSDDSANQPISEDETTAEEANDEK